MSAHKGNVVTVVRSSAPGDPGVNSGTTPANSKLVQLPTASPIISSSLVSLSVMPIPTQGLCYTALNTEIV